MESAGKFKVEQGGEEYIIESWTGADLDVYWLPQDWLERNAQFYFLPGAPETVPTLKETEDKVLATLDQLDDLEKWITFKQLYNSGYRMSNAESEIRKLVKARKASE